MFYKINTALEWSVKYFTGGLKSLFKLNSTEHDVSLKVAENLRQLLLPHAPI